MPETADRAITKELYRDALHVYLKHSYPDDDLEYYSKWAWMVSPRDDFFEDRGNENNHWPKPARGFPTEVRFGCHCSGNVKLRCYADGFWFDANDGGDPPEICTEVRRIGKVVTDEWRRLGIPIHGDDK